MPAHATPQTEADAWAALLDTLGLDRVVVMSFSAGTAPAVAFALRYPERVSRLVLFVPAAGGMIGEKAAGPPAFVMNTVLKWDFPFWAAMHLSPKTMFNVVGVPASLVPALSLEERAELDRSIRQILPVSTRRHGMMYDGAFQLSLFRFPLEKITTPTLVISAADDLYLTLRVARHAAKVIPQAKLIEFASGGHLLLGHAGEVWPAVAAFLQDSSEASVVATGGVQSGRRP
jgi:2-hydroxy-6-oxonona-2,4-dienedioate hydrolase